MKTRRNATTKTAAVAALVLAAFAANPVAPAHSTGTRASQTIAPGVVLKRVTEPGPNRVKVLIIDPSQAASIDTTMARSTFGGWARTSDMATAHGALAAVNGDFGISPGRPGHLFAEDGDLKQTTVLGNDGKNFAVSADESNLYLDSPNVSVTVLQVASRKTWTVDRWNQGGISGGQVSGYSAVGGSVEPTPRSSCSARLNPVTGPAWGAGQIGVARDYTVDAVACGATSMSLNGGVVLSSSQSGIGAALVKGLTRGETVRMTWSLGWAGVLDSIGGSPILLQNGKVVVTNCSSYLCEVHPRTAVGTTADGKVIIMVVDGRWPGYSVGMNLVQLANEMKKFGAVNALNLDGGGSSTMWVRGMGVINKPSDGTERSVSNALLVLPGADTGEPSLVRPVIAGMAEIIAATDPDPGAAFNAALTDPGSTGGWLDSLDPTALDQRMQQNLDTFRASQR